MIYVALVFAATLTGTLLIPAVRPFFAAFHGGAEGPMHAFMSVNMLGAAIGAPFVGAFADRNGRRGRLAALLFLIDGAAMLLAAYADHVAIVLTARAVQGAASVGALSIVMGAFRGAAHGKAMGTASAAIVSAIACGAPLGSLAVSFGPRAALLASAVLSLVAVPFARALPDTPPRVRGSAGAVRPLILPTLLVALERFAVGTFIVTFSLYAHSALAKTDAQVGLLFTAFLVPFAVFSALVGRALAAGWRRAPMLLAGGLVYGTAIALLGRVDGALLWCVLAAGGVASAALYAPALTIAVARVPDDARAMAMGLVNAGGTLGMMLGTAVAGIVSVQLVHGGMDANEARRLIFAVSGAFVACGFVIGAAAAKRE